MVVIRKIYRLNYDEQKQFVYFKLEGLQKRFAEKYWKVGIGIPVCTNYFYGIYEVETKTPSSWFSWLEWNEEYELGITDHRRLLAMSWKELDFHLQLNGVDVDDVVGISKKDWEMLQRHVKEIDEKDEK